MSHSNNPFVRGYDGLSVQRLLAISYDDDCPLSYLPLHVSQSHLPDSQVERHACVFCDDFHIHTYHSADSSDDVEYKVKGAIADGLEIPVSSEHEYIIDFQPFIQKLGLTRWAFGVPSRTCSERRKETK